MDFVVRVVLFGGFVVICGNALKAPSYIRPCDDTSAKCLVPTIQHIIPHFVKGIPELGVDILDPFHVDHVENELAGGLLITFDNGTLTGFKKCIVDDARANLDKGQWQVAFHCNVTVKGHYTAKGSLMGFGIGGDGEAKIKMTNLRMDVKLKTEYKRHEDNDIYIRIKQYTYNYKYGDKIHYDFTNLFPGNNELSDVLLRTLNMNSLAVAEEFGAPLIKVSVDRVMNNIRKFFKAVPYHELVDIPLPEGAKIVG